ncbi:Phosphatidylserine decarboxylase proenzyme 3 [Lachnellula cervina]|uniref:Phosphatidylserine decarboxylase proenzyme 3 n=1 Tax=Lachnellula cervina TaxID=1316786 RepID=A0A7D8YQQ2_9HELO|nr:Phosphatidylserine decarboxylase proenzyme 3 [Lachnellula cervina]
MAKAVALPLRGVQFEPIVIEFAKKVQSEPGWKDRFDKAIKQAKASGIQEMDKISSMDDFYQYIQNWLFWIPKEGHEGKDIYNQLCLFYFIFDQKAVLDLQSPIKPGQADKPLSWISNWLVRYAKSLGEFLDKPESLTEESLKTYYDSPHFNMQEYIAPRGGWKTFNALFFRDFKPGYRPIAAIADPTVIVSPADSTYAGQWEIRSDSGVDIKHIHWPISELLHGSPYKDRFRNGLFIHSFLGPADYHRQHAPVGGKVLEARVIQGQVYLEVNPKKNDDGRLSLTPQRKLHNTVSHQDVVASVSGDLELDAPDTAGYQFCQTRGLIVLETAIGLIAILPMGMAQVSSVNITCEEGVTLRKGEEISYFAFGGSDIVVVFEATSNVSMTAQVGTHYKVGNRIAQAFPIE